MKMKKIIKKTKSTILELDNDIVTVIVISHKKGEEESWKMILYNIYNIY